MATAQHAEQRADRAKLEEFTDLVATYERHDHLAQAHYQTRLDASTVRAEVNALDTASERATVAHVAFRRALEDVYRDPDRARQAFVAVARTHGVSQTMY